MCKCEIELIPVYENQKNDHECPSNVDPIAFACASKSFYIMVSVCDRHIDLLTISSVEDSTYHLYNSSFELQVETKYGVTSSSLILLNQSVRFQSTSLDRNIYLNTNHKMYLYDITKNHLNRLFSDHMKSIVEMKSAVTESDNHIKYISLLNRLKNNKTGIFGYPRTNIFKTLGEATRVLEAARTNTKEICISIKLHNKTSDRKIKSFELNWKEFEQTVSTNSSHLINIEENFKNHVEHILDKHLSLLGYVDPLAYLGINQPDYQKYNNIMKDYYITKSQINIANAAAPPELKSNENPLIQPVAAVAEEDQKEEQKDEKEEKPANITEVKQEVKQTSEGNHNVLNNINANENKTNSDPPSSTQKYFDLFPPPIWVIFLIVCTLLLLFMGIYIISFSSKIEIPPNKYCPCALDLLSNKLFQICEGEENRLTEHRNNLANVTSDEEWKTFYDLCQYNTNITSCSYGIGYMYEKGHYIKQNETLSLYYYKNAADNGHKIAQFIVGLHYFDIFKYSNCSHTLVIRNYLELSAKQHFYDAQYTLRFMYSECLQYFHETKYPLALSEICYPCENHTEKALFYSRLLADQGDRESQMRMGYDNAQDKNYSLAFHYFKMAAEQGDTIAMYKVGLYLDYGYIGEKDFNKAFYFYKLSADTGQGYMHGQVKTAYFYLHGIGVNQNYTEAKRYYEMAAKKGNPKNFNISFSEESVQNKQSQLFVDLLSNKVFRTFEINGIDWLKNSEARLPSLPNEEWKKFYELCQYNIIIPSCASGIGYMYYFRNQNKTLGFHFLIKGADNGHKIAQFFVGDIYYRDTIGAKNYTQAFKYFELAAKQNVPAAQYKLGLFYKDGIGCKKAERRKALQF